MLPSVRSPGRGSVAKSALLRDLLTRGTAIAKPIQVKIMTGDLRIGAEGKPGRRGNRQEAYGGALKEVQRANSCWGHWRDTKLAKTGGLPTRNGLFHPLGFMLASPLSLPRRAEYFPRRGGG